MGRLAIVAVLFGLSPLSASGGFAQTTPTPFTVEDYADAVHQYFRGDFIRAGHRLYRVPLEELRQASEDYRRGWLVESQLKAAALLHTQLALQSGELESFHLETARVLLEQIEEDSRRQSFLQRWYLAVGYHYYSKLRLSDADLVFATAAESFPDDSDLLLARGSLIECSAWMLGDDSVLDSAQSAFDRLLRAEPNHAEARLRRAHIMLLRGQMQQENASQQPAKKSKQPLHDEAYRETRWVLEHTEDPQLALVAHLLLGDIYKDRGELFRATESYQAGAEIDPHCQAGAIALSLTLRLSGDRDASREVMRHFLNITAKSPIGIDGWWRFVLGKSLQSESMSRLMREEMRE